MSRTREGTPAGRPTGAEVAAAPPVAASCGGRSASSPVRGAAVAPLAIVGTCPPPYGGVSVSLMRLLPYLDASGIDYVVYNTGTSRTDHPRIRDVGWSWRWMLGMLLRSRHRVMQFSTSRWQARVFAALINWLRGTRVIIYARGYSLPDSYFRANRLQRAMVRWALRRTARVFAPNPDLKERIAEIGYERTRIHTIPPFIPPVAAPHAADIPEPVRQFCSGKGPILVANGAFVLVNGADVYGLRAMVDMVQVLLPRFARMGVVVYMRRGAHQATEAFVDLRGKLEQPPLSNHVLLYDSPADFLPVLSIADVFLRPTTTDGDANSIREALQFGVPVVASDAVPRPEGCRLYSAGDLDALADAVADVLGDVAGERVRVAAAPKYNAADVLLPVYRELLAAPA